MNVRMPILLTPRLILREIQEKDSLDMFEYACLSFVGPSAGWKPHISPSETKAIIKMFHEKKRMGQLGTFAIVWRENSKMIGTVELHTYVKNFKAELGYTVHPDYWGKGIAAEASKEVLAWGFDVLGLKRIECTSFLDNIQSQRVCEKIGFIFEGVKRKCYINYDGTIHDINCFALTDEDYFERKCAKTW